MSSPILRRKRLTAAKMMRDMIGLIQHASPPLTQSFPLQRCPGQRPGNRLEQQYPYILCKVGLSCSVHTCAKQRTQNQGREDQSSQDALQLHVPMRALMSLLFAILISNDVNFRRRLFTKDIKVVLSLMPQDRTDVLSRSFTCEVRLFVPAGLKLSALPLTSGKRPFQSGSYFFDYFLDDI